MTHDNVFMSLESMIRPLSEILPRASNRFLPLKSSSRVDLPAETGFDRVASNSEVMSETHLHQMGP